MKISLFAVSAVVSSVVLAGPVLAQGAGGPAVVAPASPSVTSQSTVVSSGIQSQTNTTAYVTLPGISSVIQQTLLGPKLAGPRAGAELSPMHSGMAAGDDPWGWQAWIQGGGGNTVNSLATGGYNIANYGTQIGVQAQINPQFLLGVSGSWQGSNGTLNGGYSSSNSTFGATVYAGWQFNENWNASAMAGYSSGTNTLNNSNFNYNANYASSQWSFQGGLNGYYKVGAVVVAPMVSILYSPINSYGYTDSNLVVVPGQTTALTRGSAGGFLIRPGSARGADPKRIANPDPRHRRRAAAFHRLTDEGAPRRQRGLAWSRRDAPGHKRFERRRVARPVAARPLRPQHRSKEPGGRKRQSACRPRLAAAGSAVRARRRPALRVGRRHAGQ